MKQQILIERELQLSILVVCHNVLAEIETCLVAWEKTVQELKINPLDYEYVIINDGSNDGTSRVLDRLRRENKSIRVFHQLNTGNSKAMRRAMELARGKYIFSTSPFYSPAHFKYHWELRHSYSVTTSVRVPDARHWLVKTSQTLLKQWIFFLYGIEIQAPLEDFRLYHRLFLIQCLEQISPHSESIVGLIPITAKRIHPDWIQEIRLDIGMLNPNYSDGTFHYVSQAVTLSFEIFSIKIKEVGAAIRSFLHPILRPIRG